MITRVLHLCPLWWPVSEEAPGGIETFLATLVRASHEAGCAPKVLASGDSTVDAEVVSVIDENLYGLMARGEAAEYIYYEQSQLAMAIAMAASHDVIHSHIGPSGYVLSALPELRGKVLHTQHNPVTRDQGWFLRRHPRLPLTAVSEFTAAPLRTAGATDCLVVPNGVDVKRFPHSDDGGPGLAFLGRMEREKGAQIAVRLAQELELPLTLAGPVIDSAYFAEHVERHLSATIRYVGVLGHDDKCALLAGSGCALLPFPGGEPFGLVSIEAMACGTPVVALRTGALPEIVEDGLTGFLADEESGLAALVAPAMTLDRATVRARVEQRFDIAVVARRYSEVYGDMIQRAAESPSPAGERGHAR